LQKKEEKKSVFGPSPHEEVSMTSAAAAAS